MVVTRRAPTAPTPTSRTSSSQPVPRAKKPQVPPVPSPLANGESREGPSQNDASETYANDTGSPLKKGKHKSKEKHKKKKDKKGSGKEWSFVDLLTRIFLLWFTIYSLSVCPTDEHLKSPVCRGLSEYRRLFLEPYVFPAFHRALAHPAVAPYVERVQPYADRVINTAKPIVFRTKLEFNNRVVPQWNKHVVPQWNNVVLPLWNKHAAPHIQSIEKQLQPYRTKVIYEYQHRVEPHLRVAVNNLQKWQRQAQPYVILAAHKTYNGYQKTKPYALPVWEQFKLLLSQLAQFLSIQRRQYVDPHVKKIWERVIELSGGKPTVNVDKQSASEAPVYKAARSTTSVISSAFSSESTVVPRSSEVVVDSASSVLSEPTTQSQSLPASISHETISQSSSSNVAQASETLSSLASVVSSSAQATALSVSSGVKDAASSASSVVSSVTASVVPSASTLTQEPSVPVSSVTSQAGSSATVLASSASSITEQTFSSASESVLDGVTDASSAVNSFASSISSSPIPTRSPVVDDDDIDLDAFYAELGLGDDPASDVVISTEAAPPIETESEEEIAERRRLREIETAKKRADITGRHTEWERQLEAAIVENRKALRKALVALRKAAAAELKENAEIRKELENLEEDAEKYLRGAEKYLANLKRESRKEDEKRSMWARVVDKVDAKFAERLGQAENVVNSWYLEKLNKELEEVKRVSDIVRDIADRGQTDIGLDYAWLDDVTYQDWQRYHDLVRRSENFTAQAHAIQNGSHPSPPINPILTALSDLQIEVQDTVLGFETRLRRINRHGERSFGSKDGQDPIDDEIILDETVSILPIEDEAHRAPAEGETPVDIPQVIIGRGKEEVISALNRAAEQESATSAPKEHLKNPEQVVEAIAHEVEEDTRASSSVHEEL
ncbi:unnamed protein product [Somion occarium]|uniref:Uncharacterized protein n=1 Tax=Somion occarium TaxID=3059160 RepID=A0ABP1E571_9APHY